ncbi:hypothetical protein CcaverHIS002_0108490 [Cutaneotrichosporon cavernicola]|uniref:Uncharacterized protein n=1 Tax=Cutaneotrichosporon cavernicola TaxID=279322 RepID=A0AA48I213_9TREE|nr:uncharacterized protein CcaverHIS019_0108420 [Cutaneotrichosporon cavernicola]BEI80320.1 hypothetical protein CcaverHIS002_0108490 [Cutaneotrichosporon cavernicola]BEI88124.1 hypothetical protein CcaverHIS019_0108420 [Cutaneotrichosporon cavernicola]BEJ03669.1 hypothetical protein CcaverHIS641_0108440 [Cutaneotrichosporon cavernicola]
MSEPTTVTQPREPQLESQEPILTTQEVPPAAPHEHKSLRDVFRRSSHDKPEKDKEKEKPERRGSWRDVFSRESHSESQPQPQSEPNPEHSEASPDAPPAQPEQPAQPAQGSEKRSSWKMFERRGSKDPKDPKDTKQERRSSWKDVFHKDKCVSPNEAYGRQTTTAEAGTDVPAAPLMQSTGPNAGA